MNHTLPKVGVSACLLGHPVRYDGGHKRHAFIAGPLSAHLEFVALCPETAIGLGVPRPTIRLLGNPERPRLVGTDDSGLDVTLKMEAYGRRQAGELTDLCGFILKENSPSCGVRRVKVFRANNGHMERKGSGVFARILRQRLPLLPMEDEGRLNDAVLRENFINRVYVMHRWQKLISKGLSRHRLIEFHTSHKYLLMAHSQAAYGRLGRRLADLSHGDLPTIAERYSEELMQTLKRRITRKRHANVLQHIMGHLKKRIDQHERRELNDSIEAYRRGEIPLSLPITLLRHLFQRYPDSYIERQLYLRPHPDGLGLRNEI